MVPERARGTGKVDARSDIYSFGCIIFAMLTGEPPFVREGVGDLVVAHITEPAPELEGRIPGLPSELAAVVRACLAKDPADRPQDMRAVEHQLRVIARAVPPARLRPAMTPLPSAVGGEELPTVTPAATAIMPTPAATGGGRHARLAGSAQRARRDDRRIDLTDPVHARERQWAGGGSDEGPGIGYPALVEDRGSGRCAGAGGCDPRCESLRTPCRPSERAGGGACIRSPPGGACRAGGDGGAPARSAGGHDSAPRLAGRSGGVD